MSTSFFLSAVYGTRVRTPLTLRAGGAGAYLDLTRNAIWSLRTRNWHGSCGLRGCSTVERPVLDSGCCSDSKAGRSVDVIFWGKKERSWHWLALERLRRCDRGVRDKRVDQGKEKRCEKNAWNREDKMKQRLDVIRKWIRMGAICECGALSVIQKR